MFWYAEPGGNVPTRFVFFRRDIWPRGRGSPGACVVLCSFIHHTVYVHVPIQSRKKVDESILGETSTFKEVDNNFCNKKPKIGQVKDIRVYSRRN